MNNKKKTRNLPSFCIKTLSYESSFNDKITRRNKKREKEQEERKCSYLSSSVSRSRTLQKLLARRERDEVEIWGCGELKSF